MGIFSRNGQAVADEPLNRAEKYLRHVRNPDSADALQLVDCIVADAIESAASDVHIEPWDGELLVRFRINGLLKRYAVLPIELLDRVAGRARVMGDMTQYQPMKPQEGHFDWEHLEGGAVQLRISVFPSTHGEKMVLRLFDTRERRFSLDDLGFEDAFTQRLKLLLESPNGTVLFTGPTGSGKTTVMYGGLSYLSGKFGESISISTIEDPVEYNLAGICQASVDVERKFTYPAALRALMRQDPQVILVGEIRDRETASIAINAGLTGHLVLSSIHSPGTAGVFARLIHMGIEPFLVASSIRSVVGLRLVRENCPYCSVPYSPDQQYMCLLPKTFIEDAQFRTGQGCEQCQFTGLKGRKALQELLIVSEEIQRAVLEKLPTSEIEKIAVSGGMLTLWETGLQRVSNGNMTLEELLRVAGDAVTRDAI